MEKRKLWGVADPEERNLFVWELINGTAYLSEDKKHVLFVRLPTDQEAEGFYGYSEPDFLELYIDEDGSEEYVVTHTLEAKDLVKKLKEAI